MLRFGTDQWVDDDVINAAQYLLKQQNCTIDGFQNTLLASKLQVEPTVPSTHKFTLARESLASHVQVH